MTIVEPVPTVQTRYTGTSVRRTEDPRLLAGRGQYVDDVTVPKMIEAAVLRSPVAHARITSIDTSRARELPGVFDVIVGCGSRRAGRPAAGHLVPDPGAAHRQDPRARRSTGCAGSGQAVAAVVAVDRYVAEDALELIDVEYEPLPVVADLEAALAPDAPKLYDDWPDNVSGSLTYTAGDADCGLRVG